MDNAAKTVPPLLPDDKDADLPWGVITLPDIGTPTATALATSDEPPTETPAADAEVPAAPPIVIAPILKNDNVPEDPLRLGTLKHRILQAKEGRVGWFKAHKFLGGILLFLMLGVLLYFWPIIACALAAQHMLKNTKGTVNKGRMYKIVAGLALISVSVQALWIVQLAQATPFSLR